MGEIILGVCGCWVTDGRVKVVIKLPYSNNSRGSLRLGFNGIVTRRARVQTPFLPTR